MHPLRSPRTWLGLFILFALLVVAYLQGRALSHLLSAALMPLPGKNKWTVLPRERDDAAPFRAALPIHERNPFDSVRGALVGSDTHDTTTTLETEDVLGDVLSAAPCQDVNLSIVSESTDVGWSAATLSYKGARPALRRVGDTIGEAEVVFIGTNPRFNLPTVWLNDGDLCQTSLFEQHTSEEEKGARERPNSEEKRERPLRDDVVSPLIARIKRLGKDEFRVDRSVVEELMSNPTLMGSTGLRPNQVDGRILGMRVFGVRPGSLFGSLGIENGDRIESVNSFSLERDGKKMHVTVHVD